MDGHHLVAQEPAGRPCPQPVGVIDAVGAADNWDRMAKDLRPVYTAPTETAAKERLGELHATWGEKYPAIQGPRDNAWAGFAPFLDYSPEIRRVIYSTNAVESLNARTRRATRARCHFPTSRQR